MLTVAETICFQSFFTLITVQPFFFGLVDSLVETANVELASGLQIPFLEFLRSRAERARAHDRLLLIHYVPYFRSPTKRLVVTDDRRGAAADRLCNIGQKIEPIEPRQDVRLGSKRRTSDTGAGVCPLRARKRALN